MRPSQRKLKSNSCTHIVCQRTGGRACQVQRANYLQGKKFVPISFANTQEEGLAKSKFPFYSSDLLVGGGFEYGRRAIVRGADDAGVTHAVQLAQIIRRRLGDGQEAARVAQIVYHSGKSVSWNIHYRRAP